MAVTAADCQRMIAGCDKNRVKLMIAYRLHFVQVRLKAIGLVRAGRIGEPKFFNSAVALPGSATPGPTRGSSSPREKPRLVKVKSGSED